MNERLTQINQKINLESDEVLYPEANAFAERMIKEDVGTLGNLQVRGLYDMTLGHPVAIMLQFLHNQQERATTIQKQDKVPQRIKDIASYYKALEEYFVALKSRINGDFNFNADESEIDEIHRKLVKEFVQHLIAANGEKAMNLALARQIRHERYS